MTLIKNIVDNYLNINLEIKMLNYRKKMVEIEIQNLIYDNYKSKALELNMELDALDYAITEIEKIEIDFNNLIMAFAQNLNNIEAYVFVNCIIKQENEENVAKSLNVGVEKIKEIIKKVENDFELCTK